MHGGKKKNLAELITLVPTIIKVIDEALKSISGRRKLNEAETKDIRQKLGESKEKLDSLREELYKAGKQILDYKELYRNSI